MDKPTNNFINKKREFTFVSAQDIQNSNENRVAIYRPLNNNLVISKENIPQVTSSASFEIRPRKFNTIRKIGEKYISIGNKGVNAGARGIKYIENSLNSTGLMDSFSNALMISAASSLLFDCSLGYVKQSLNGLKPSWFPI